MANSKNTPPAYSSGDWHAHHDPDTGRWAVLARRTIKTGDLLLDCDHKLAQVLFRGREAEANARLMAAAPALLETCEELVAIARSVAGNWESGHLDAAVRSLVRSARAASGVIAKVRGSAG